MFGVFRCRNCNKYFFEIQLLELTPAEISVVCSMETPVDNGFCSEKCIAEYTDDQYDFLGRDK